MGWLKNILFREDKKTKQEEKIEENAQSYVQATITNVPVCNGCGQDIEGTPRIKNHMGKTMYFHKRCWKAMQRGEIPKPLNKEEQKDL